MTLYSLENLSREFKGKRVLDVDALEIEKGYIYALLGPNGSGKTTLLNILGFLDSPSGGYLNFLGNPVQFNERHLQKLRKKVVMVHQSPILFSTTVFKNLEFGLKFRKIPKLERQKIIEMSLDRVGLRELIDAPAHKLSGGETQRIVLARALALSPEVILCDEPTANVDLENQLIITNLLKDINSEKGITIIFTSHDKRQAASLPHHRLFLEQGKLSKFSFENSFPASLIKNRNGTSRCIIMDQLELDLPVDREGLCRVKIDAEQIRLNENPNDKSLNQKNSGHIMRIRSDDDGVRIKVDCKIQLSVRLGSKEYRDQKLMVGDEVSVYIPPEAITVL